MVTLGSLMAPPLFFADSVNDAGALMFARGDFLSVFDKSQREAMVMLFVRLHDHLIWANAFFWGLWLFPLAVLVYKSGFLPRLIGAWLFIAGAAIQLDGRQGFQFGVVRRNSLYVLALDKRRESGKTSERNYCELRTNCG